eukprot:TRINITY_DN83369_c0_g1_i1.p1 TRINITY_DN83369_c0_g1~~TRINITY_DN83369_c0_g1_i1.p1  ORF type:complete len:282 (-),score=74.42 TRINITY_DN83369_c0_g1_i1:271-1116(-)
MVAPGQWFCCRHRRSTWSSWFWRLVLVCAACEFAQRLADSSYSPRNFLTPHIAARGRGSRLAAAVASDEQLQAELEQAAEEDDDIDDVDDVDDSVAPYADFDEAEADITQLTDKLDLLEKDTLQNSRAALAQDLWEMLLMVSEARGSLDSTAMGVFAMLSGFEGSQEEWIQEFVLLCKELACSPEPGLDKATFFDMVNNPAREDCYCTEEELQDIHALLLKEIEAADDGYAQRDGLPKEKPFEQDIVEEQPKKEKNERRDRSQRTRRLHKPERWGKPPDFL